MNTHVRSYIQQHNLAYVNLSSANGDRTHLTPHQPFLDTPFAQWGIPSNDSTPRRLPDFGRLSPKIKKVPLSARFPFNQCTDPHLRETKHSLEASIRSFVSNRESVSIMNSCRGILQENDRDKDDWLKDDWLMKSASPTPSSSPSTRSDSSTLPPIILKDTCEPKRGELVRLLNKCFLKYFLDKTHMAQADALLEDTVICATNLLLQEYDCDDSSKLCAELQDDFSKGVLRNLLTNILEQVEERHVGEGIDDLQDAIREMVMLEPGFGHEGTETENCGLYELFKKSWRLNPALFLEYDLESFLAFCCLDSSRPYTNFSCGQQCLKLMEEAAVQMNVVRFFYVYRWELGVSDWRNKAADPHGMEVLQQLLRDTAARLSHDVDMAKPKQSGRKKTLRFLEDALDAGQAR